MQVHQVWGKTLWVVWGQQTVLQPNKKEAAGKHIQSQTCPRFKPKNEHNKMTSFQLRREKKDMSVQLKGEKYRCKKLPKIILKKIQRKNVITKKGVKSNQNNPETWDICQNETENHSELWHVMTQLRAGSAMRSTGQQAYAVRAVSVIRLLVLRPVEGWSARTGMRELVGRHGGVGLVGLG